MFADFAVVSVNLAILSAKKAASNIKTLLNQFN